MASEKVHIRKAVKQDCSLILQFIKELASYENLEHEVVGTTEDLEETLFKSIPHAEVLIMEEESFPIGFVLFFHNYSTFLCRYGIYIEDLYIREAYRAKGYGRMLIQAVCRIASERNCGRVEWWCLDWNKKAIQFYKNLGAIPMDEWTVFRLERETFKKLGEKK